MMALLQMPEWLGPFLKIAGWLSLGGVWTLAFVAGAFIFPRWRELFIGAAVLTVVVTTFFGWGVKQAGELCEARFAQAERQFLELQTRVNALTAEHAKQLAAALDERDGEILKLVTDYEQDLARLKDQACLVDESDLRRLLPLTR
jgi:hypothetical protein